MGTRTFLNIGIETFPFVIPANVEIPILEILVKNLDSGVRRNDETTI